MYNHQQKLSCQQILQKMLNVSSLNITDLKTTNPVPEHFLKIVLSIEAIASIARCLKQNIHLQTCSENLFFHELPANQGKLTNQLRTTGSCMKIICDIGKSSCKHGRKQKFRQIPYPLSRKHPLCLSKKNDWDGLQWTVCEQFANPVLTTLTSCLRTGSQVYTQLNMLNQGGIYLNKKKLRWSDVGSLWQSQILGNQSVSEELFQHFTADLSACAVASSCWKTISHSIHSNKAINSCINS